LLSRRWCSGTHQVLTGIDLKLRPTREGHRACARCMGTRARLAAPVARARVCECVEPAPSAQRQAADGPAWSTIAEPSVVPQPLDSGKATLLPRIIPALAQVFYPPGHRPVTTPVTSRWPIDRRTRASSRHCGRKRPSRRSGKQANIPIAAARATARTRGFRTALPPRRFMRVRQQEAPQSCNSSHSRTARPTARRTLSVWKKR
jgi:hypothetical protein